MKNNTEMTITSNQSKRHFTIRKYADGRLITKYRTNEMSREEFEDKEYYINEDWRNFLRKSGDYYCVS